MLKLDRLLTACIRPLQCIREFGLERHCDQPTLRGLSAESRLCARIGSREQVAGRSGRNGAQGREFIPGTWIWVIVSVFLLSSCSCYHHVQEKSAQRKACFAHCEQRCVYCESVCDDNAKLCSAKNDAQAAVHYALNRHQQKVKGQVVVADMTAFRDPLACTKTTCHCEKDKKMCKQVCRGKIYKRLQSAMLFE